MEGGQASPLLLLEGEGLHCSICHQISSVGAGCTGIRRGSCLWSSHGCLPSVSVWLGGGEAEVGGGSNKERGAEQARG